MCSPWGTVMARGQITSAMHVCLVLAHSQLSTDVDMAHSHDTGHMLVT